MQAEEVLEMFKQKIKDANLDTAEMVKDVKSASNYGARVSRVAYNVISSAIKSGYDVDDDFIRRMLGSVLNESYYLTNNAGRRLQHELFEQLKVGLRVRDGYGAKDRDRIIELAENAGEQVIETIREPVLSYGKKVVGSVMRENANLLDSVGVEITVVRKNDHVGLHSGTKYAKQCTYCDQWEGVWTAPIPPEVFGYHDGCGCTLEYYNKAGNKKILERNDSNHSYNG